MWKRRGAKLGWPQLVVEPKIVGPANLLETEDIVGWGDDTVFLTEDSTLLPYLGRWHRARIRIGSYTQIGGGSVIYPGVTIGRVVLVGASTIVNRDVPRETLATGRPFRAIGGIRAMYEQRVAQIEAHPEWFPEEFPYFGGRPPWLMTDQSERWWYREVRIPTMARLRNLLRGAMLWVWDSLQEPDQYRASQQRIHMMRKAGYSIGEHCYIDPRAVIDPRTRFVSIGNHCVIAAYVSIFAHDGFHSPVTGRVRVVPVKIHDGCSIGTAALILPGVTIGPGSVVQPGSVVTKDVPPFTVVAGAPARQKSSLWDWLEEQKREINDRPEEYVAEPRLALYPIPPR